VDPEHLQELVDVAVGPERRARHVAGVAPVKDERPRDVIDGPARLEDADEPFQVSELGHVRLKPADLAERLHPYGASRHVPPAALEKSVPRRARAGDDRGRPRRQILSGHGPVPGKPVVPARAYASGVLGAAIDALEHRLEPVGFRDVVRMKDEHPIGFVAYLRENAVDARPLAQVDFVPRHDERRLLVGPGGRRDARRIVAGGVVDEVNGLDPVEPRLGRDRVESFFDGRRAVVARDDDHGFHRRRLSFVAPNRKRRSRR